MAKKTMQWRVAADPPAKWDRQQGETMYWYSRFEEYRLAGPKRKLEPVWRKEQERDGKVIGKHRMPYVWQETATNWCWKERAEAWDQAEIYRVRQEFAEEAKQDKKSRILMLKAARGKLLEALKAVDLTNVKIGEVMSGIAKIAEQLRNEYEDQRTRKFDLTEEEADAAIWEGLAQLAARSQDGLDLLVEQFTEPEGDESDGTPGD